jgi:formate dehydrogenase subunit delta
MREIEHLVKMANQIADNFSFHEDAADRVRDHLQRFWAPSMRRGLADFARTGGREELRPAVREAVGRLSGD